MAEKKLHLRIITPTEKKVDEYIKMIIVRCITGNLGILPGHEAYSAVLDYGILRILNDVGERQMITYGGLVTVQNDAVTIVTSGAEWPEEIDYARAKAEREHIERHLREKTDDIEIKKDQVRLRRVLMQIEVSSSSIIDD